MLKDTFQIYLNRLVDLSGRNRSLYLPKLVSSQMVDLNEFHFLNGHPSFGYVEALLNKKPSFPLIPFSDPRDKNINQVSQKLNRLQHLIKLMEDETGEKSLYIGWPFVEGKLLNDQLIRCPLLFFPVELKPLGGNWKLERNPDDQPFFNKAFLLAYSHQYGTTNDSKWQDNFLEEFSKEPLVFRTQLYEYLKNEFVINFNQELFENKIIGFPESTKSQDDTTLKTGVLKLQPYGVLGQYSQKTSFLVQDYEQLLEGEELNDLESLFQKWFSGSKNHHSLLKEDKMFTIFPMDSSQEDVYRSVRLGQSCVVEGPPGTGKSQLISNLVIDFITRGKKVLVVSQKRSALDVVFERLENKGFGAFLALVHDFRTDRNLLFKKLLLQIESLERYQELNRSIDAIHLERQFLQLSRLIDSHLENLEEFRNALFNSEDFGIPVKELYVSSLLSDEALDMSQTYKEFKWERVEGFLRDCREYFQYYRKYEDPDSFWCQRVDFANLGSNEIPRLKECLLEIEGMKENVNYSFSDNPEIQEPSLLDFYVYREKLIELKKLLDYPDVLDLFNHIRGFDSNVFDLNWLENRFDAVKSLFKEEGVEWVSEEEKLEGNYQLILEYIELKKSWWKSFYLPFRKKRFLPLFKLLKINKLGKGDKDIMTLKIRLENRLILNEQYSLLSEKPWIHLPPKPFDYPTFTQSATALSAAIRLKLLLEELGAVGKFFMHFLKEGNPMSFPLNEVHLQVEKLDRMMPKWSKYFTFTQIQHLFNKHIEDTNGINSKIEFIFDDLVALDQLKNRLRPIEREVIHKLLSSYPHKDFEGLKKVFLAGLRLSWIDHIENKYPILKSAGTPKFSNALEELREAVLEKGNISQHIAILKLREKTIQNLEYNRLNNLLTYRGLKHQVSKKKKIWPIKQLVEEYDEEIFKLIPCWLASPETVSALFPLHQSFDLVVFDESSQCNVERGIPAMLRGKQVVIAGDSHQLQPLDLYQTRLDTDEEGIETETESLLALATGYFQKFWLKCHYRSAQLPLIDFSNRMFYDNRLNMLPEMKISNSKELPFELVKVDGVWDRQANIEEAEAVLDLVKRLRKENPDDSIGVITFNFFQREIIQQKIDEDFQSQIREVSVKNIENVQGDEYDWVIFSIGYAKNKSGKLIANFGLLSKKGGINRLNVAITRAKKKIILVTSLNSGDFKSEQLKNDGVRMLKEYIEFVEQVCQGELPEMVESKHSGFEISWILKNKLEGIHEDFELEKFHFSTWMDLAMKKNQQYISALLTDDQRLYNATGAKEAFVYHPVQLNEKGWPYHFYFSRQYWMGKNILEDFSEEN